jgi:8-oxo-dGTP pyrophosphatase MutT (NUDIX family)
VRRIFLVGILIALSSAFAGSVAFSQHQHGRKPFRGAGVLPYSVYGGKIYVLLGYDPGRGWTSFGGAPEKVVSVADANPRWETKQETAIREAFEECRMVIPLEEFRRGLEAHRFFPKTHSISDFITFTVKVHYRPVHLFARRRVPVNSRFSEKSNYVWIPLSELRQMVLRGVRELKGSPGNNKFWHTFYQGLQQLFGYTDYRLYFPR